MAACKNYFFHNLWAKFVVTNHSANVTISKSKVHNYCLTVTNKAEEVLHILVL